MCRLHKAGTIITIPEPKYCAKVQSTGTIRASATPTGRGGLRPLHAARHGR